MYIGNDIIVHTHSRCVDKWKDDFFLKKILSVNEIGALNESLYKNEMLWSYWTIKEAAYKLSCFLGNRNKFHAVHFEVELVINHLSKCYSYNKDNNDLIELHRIQSTVYYNNKKYKAATLITDKFIHSLVFEDEQLPLVYTAIAQHTSVHKNDYSLAARLYAGKKLEQYGINYHSIKKDKNGIPYLIYNNDKERYISLSHDQQYVSFAFTE